MYDPLEDTEEMDRRLEGQLSLYAGTVLSASARARVIGLVREFVRLGEKRAEKAVKYALLKDEAWMGRVALRATAAVAAVEESMRLQCSHADGAWIFLLDLAAGVFLGELKRSREDSLRETVALAKALLRKHPRQPMKRRP